MATKKKKKVSKTKRSRAAKKGWETRRRKQLEQKMNAAHPELIGVETEFKDAVTAEVERITPEIRAQIAKDLVEKYIKDGAIVIPRGSKGTEERIRARLRIAWDDDRFYDEVLELGDEFPEYSLHEIYTMGVSP